MPTLDRDEPLRTAHDSESITEPGEPASWRPGPGRSFAIDLPTPEAIRVEILSDGGDPPLAAVIELVSPRNKDRPRARRAFVAKCAGHLESGRGLVIVDVVTNRRADLHAELLAYMGAAAEPGEGGLMMAAYRAEGREQSGRLLAWTVPLAVGRPLPTLPLWLSDELAVPLDLEASHSAACGDLRIRPAG